MITGTPAKLQIIRADNLAGERWLVHGFSTRVGGFSRAYGGHALNLGFTKDDEREAVERNRAAFLVGLAEEKPHPVCPKPGQTRVGHPPQRWRIVGLRQIHSDVIHLVEHVPEAPLAGDGLLTRTPGLLLTIKTADCLPVLLADPRRRAVGAFHAGWRGTVKRIVEKGVGEMRRRFGSDPRDLLAAIGPGIHRCCYAVGEEVRDQFASQFPYAEALFEERPGDSDAVRERYPLLFLTARAPGHSELPKKILLDLVEANRRQLLAAGVPEANISAAEFCTSCRSDLFFSYRREGPTGRMMAAVGIIETDF